MPAAFYVLFGAAFTVGVCLAAGTLLLRALPVRLYRQEERIIAFVTGSALLSLLVFLLCSVHLARKGVFLALGLAILAMAFVRGAHRGQGDRLPPVSRGWRLFFWIPYAAFGLWYFVNAMAPEFSPDGSAYHLAIVSRYYRARGFEAITTNMYASLSHAVDLLFLFAFAFGRHSAAALVHCAFLFTLPLAIRSYGRRFGMQAAGTCAALLVFCTPAAGVAGVSAYNDVALACVAFTLFYLLRIGDGAEALAGLLAGFCYAIKYTAFAAVPYALALLVIRRKGKQALLAGCCAALMIAPWMIKNWIVVQNPVAPFFNAWFPNPHVTIAFEKDYAASMRSYVGIGNNRDLPVELTIRGGVLGGLLGPVWLLAPLGLLALRTGEGRQALLAALVFGAIYATNVGTRFLLPALPFLALALAIGLRTLAAPVVLAHLILSWPPIVSLYCTPTTWRVASFPWRAALRLEPEETYLIGLDAAYHVARLIEKEVPPGQRVLSFNQIPAAYTTREILVAYQSAHGNTLRDMIYLPLMPDAIPTGHFLFRFPPRTLRRVRVVQTEKGEPDLWSVSEMRVYSSGRELPRAPEWRLQAKPNPWQVQLAFDNSPLTRWRSGQTLYPGMFVSIDFGKQETIDSLRVECARDQYKVRMRMEGDGGTGVWREIPAAVEEADVPAPRGLRRGAIEELQARGIQYLLIYDYDFGALDFRTQGAVWGVTQLAEYYGARLYRFD
jgi:hypothetical protein